SEDGNRWRTIGSLTDADDETIPCRGRGRYVRVLMKQGVSDHYVLSEMEVMGRGGVRFVAQPAPAAVGDTLFLTGGNWRIHRPRRSEERAEDMAAERYNDQSDEWLPATVPGTALASYMNVGAVPCTNYANDGVHISESYFRSDFWYRNRFTLPAGFRRGRLYLHLDGINWKARVWLNGHCLGVIEGAFVRTTYEVSRFIHEGENILAVQCICNAHFGAAKEKNAMNTAINGGILGADNPTFHATVGWDWINSTRGREVGIWNDVYLTTSSALRLSDPFVRCTLPLPDTTRATLRPEVVVSNDGGQPVTRTLVGRIGDVEFRKTVTIRAGESRTVAFEPEEFPQLNLRNPRLWWPNGYGEPYLYPSTFSTLDGATPDAEPLRFQTGIRQVTWNTASDRLTLFVNGRRFVGRGGNWGFSEHNLLYRGREYDAAVRYHREMNFTMIRNWVGQTGDDEFYDACDRYGIMVWQDFWLANPCDGPDPDDEAMFRVNAEDMVSRIRRHPCLALYCGRNEGYPPATLDKALRRLVLDLHPGLPYIGSSADDVVSGHGPYWAITPRAYF
ncbi:MAG: beta-glycosidase, partial [Bacteroidaceae bacterium]|nr:beta-glycosidase [Bacteroidaceae bacterium]